MLRDGPESALAPAAAQLLPFPTMWPLQPVSLIRSVEMKLSQQVIYGS
jgi:hypothetical protein